MFKNFVNKIIGLVWDIKPLLREDIYEGVAAKSVKKYYKTYKLLANYDKKSSQRTKILAQSRRLQKAVRGLSSVN